MIEKAGKQNDISINRLNISDGEKLDLAEFVKEFGLKIPNANDDNDTASTVNSDDSSNDSSCNTTDKMRTGRGYDVDAFTPSSPQGYDIDDFTPDNKGYDVDSFTDVSPRVKSTNILTQKCSLDAHLACHRMIPRDEDEDIDSIMPNIRKVKESIMPPLSNKLPTLNENETLEFCTIRNEAKRILAAIRESEERRKEIKRIQQQDVSDQESSVRDIDVKPKKHHYSRWLKMNSEELRTEAKRILEAVDNKQKSCIQNTVHERNQSIPEDNNPSTGRLDPIGSRFLQIENTGWFGRSSGWI